MKHEKYRLLGLASGVGQRWINRRRYDAAVHGQRACHWPEHCRIVADGPLYGGGCSDRCVEHDAVVVSAATFRITSVAKPRNRSAGYPANGKDNQQFWLLSFTMRRRYCRPDRHPGSARKPACAGLLAGLLDGFIDDPGIPV